MSGKCTVCEKDTKKKCSNCHNAYYCSREHQIEHHKAHKIDCKPFQVKESKEMGRYFVATKDIKAGKILIKEKPLLIGPSMFATLPMCLGCYKLVSADDSYYSCPKCGWPMCNEDCCSSPNHKPECDLIVAQGHKVDLQSLIDGVPLYQCVMVMRCLYSKNAEPEIWDKLIKLESHSDSITWDEIYLPVAINLRNFLTIDTFTFEEIVNICRIIMVNSFMLFLEKGNGIVCIYNITSLFGHRCISNCSKTMKSVNNKIVVVAAVDIKAGEHVSICYTDTLFGTLQRRKVLKDIQYFNCHCQRCEDVTEMGTMYGALKCQKENCGGYVLPKSFILEKQTEFDWFCNKCTTVLKSDSAEEIYDRIKEEYYAVEDNMSYESIKTFLGSNSKFIRGSHEFKVRAKYLFTKMFVNSTVHEIREEDLVLTRKYAEDVFNVLDVLTPGDIETRVHALITLHQSWIEDFRRKRIDPVLSQVALSREYLLHYKTILEKAKKLLDNELINSLFTSAVPEKCLSMLDSNMILLNLMLLGIHR